MTKKRIYHYLIISVFVSLLTSTYWTNITSKNDPTGLSSTDLFYAILMYAAVIYCFVLLIGGIASTVVHLFTGNSLISLVTFLLVGVVSYLIAQWFNIEHAYIFIISALIFGLLDILFYKKWGE